MKRYLYSSSSCDLVLPVQIRNEFTFIFGPVFASSCCTTCNPVDAPFFKEQKNTESVETPEWGAVKLKVACCAHWQKGGVSFFFWLSVQLAIWWSIRRDEVQQLNSHWVQPIKVAPHPMKSPENLALSTTILWTGHHVQYTCRHWRIKAEKRFFFWWFFS